jgi:biopolymer transport protein ExbD
LLLDRNKATVEEINRITEQLKTRAIADSTYKRLAINAKGNKAALTVLIKADDKAVYKNVIDLIDELNVCQVGKYAVVDMMPAEFDLVTAAGNK